MKLSDDATLDHTTTMTTLTGHQNKFGQAAWQVLLLALQTKAGMAA